MERPRDVPLTPWVTRLLALNGAVFLVLATVLTAPRFVAALAFDPAHFATQPWTLGTYMLAGQDLVQLILTSAVLYLFGPTVERRLGGRRFAAYYLYCGAGAGLVALCLGGVTTLNPLYTTEEVAQGGFFQQALDTSIACNLVRVGVPGGLTCFPEISAGRHRFTVRFLEQSNTQARPVQTTDDIAFVLERCVI